MEATSETGTGMGGKGGARVSLTLDSFTEQQTLSLVKVGRARRTVASGIGERRLPPALSHWLPE